MNIRSLPTVQGDQARKRNYQSLNKSNETDSNPYKQIPRLNSTLNSSLCSTSDCNKILPSPNSVYDYSTGFDNEFELLNLSVPSTLESSNIAEGKLRRGNNLCAMTVLCTTSECSPYSSPTNINLSLTTEFSACLSEEHANDEADMVSAVHNATQKVTSIKSSERANKTYLPKLCVDNINSCLTSRKCIDRNKLNYNVPLIPPAPPVSRPKPRSIPLSLPLLKPHHTQHHSQAVIPIIPFVPLIDGGSASLCELGNSTSPLLVPVNESQRTAQSCTSSVVVKNVEFTTEDFAPNNVKLYSPKLYSAPSLHYFQYDYYAPFNYYVDTHAECVLHFDECERIDWDLISLDHLTIEFDTEPEGTTDFCLVLMFHPKKYSNINSARTTTKAGITYNKICSPLTLPSASLSDPHFNAYLKRFVQHMGQDSKFCYSCICACKGHIWACTSFLCI